MLTNEQLESLRAQLRSQLASLRGQIGDERAAEATQQYRDIAGEVTDAEDDALGREITETDNAIISLKVEELRDVVAALARIDERRYGTCIDCGRDIGLARLSANPTSLRCMHCQGLHEKTYMSKPHPSL